VCNKWRIFHRAIDVYPYFCDVIFKTCCILYNFVRQRDGSQFQATLYECPLESIKAVGNRVNVTGTDMGRRAQGTKMSLRWGAWQGASLPGTYVWKKALETGTSLHRGPGGREGGGGEVRSPRTLIVEGRLWKRIISLYGRSVRGTWRGFLYWGP